MDTAALILVICLAVGMFGVEAIVRTSHKEDWYERGWKDCETAHEHFEMTPDDEEVLKELKSAIKAHIKTKGYQRRGDIKKLNRAENFGELRHMVWELCVQRKGGKRYGKH